MRRPSIALLLSLAGALLFLTSLYLPWQKPASTPETLFTGNGSIATLPNLFAGPVTIDGWSAGVGPAAAVFALALAALAAFALARPRLAGRLPLGLCALLVGYFAIAVAAETRSSAHQLAITQPGPGFHYAYGAYLGVAAATAALLAALVLRRGEIARNWSAALLVPVVIGVALLVAFLLPWDRFGPRQTFMGIANPPAVVAAALMLCLLAVWWRNDGAERLALAVAVAVFTGAAFSSLGFATTRAYGAWIGLAMAGAILALALRGAIQIPGLALPSWRTVAMTGPPALLVVSLFLPWQTACYANARDLGPYAGRCVSANGWTSTTGCAAALLALALLVTMLLPRLLRGSRIALTTAIGVLVATLGFQVQSGDGDQLRLGFGYGSTIGFIAAAIVCLTPFANVRPHPIAWNRALIRLAPIAASLAYLVVVVLPWWNVLPPHAESVFRSTPPTWLAIAGVLVAVRLLFLWIERIADTRGLTLLPLALLALATVDLIRLREEGLNWGRGLVLAIPVLLAALGRVEQREGLEHFRVPEILRVDRL